MQWRRWASQTGVAALVPTSSNALELQISTIRVDAKSYPLQSAHHGGAEKIGDRINRPNLPEAADF
jgi:hypothetical protein